MFDRDGWRARPAVIVKEVRETRTIKAADMFSGPSAHLSFESQAAASAEMSIRSSAPRSSHRSRWRRMMDERMVPVHGADAGRA